MSVILPASEEDIKFEAIPFPFIMAVLGKGIWITAAVCETDGSACWKTASQNAVCGINNLEHFRRLHLVKDVLGTAARITNPMSN